MHARRELRRATADGDAIARAQKYYNVHASGARGLSFSTDCFDAARVRRAPLDAELRCGGNDEHSTFAHARTRAHKYTLCAPLSAVICHLRLFTL